MNGNDLMNALSGLDPKYIDEAAFELHDSSSKIKKAKISRFKKVILVTVPAAAVIFLTLTVTIPFLMRMSSSESASAPASDSAAYEAEEDAAADSAPAYDSAEEAAPVAETEDAAAPAAESEEAAASVFEAEESAGAEKSETMDAADEYAAAAESEIEQAPLFEKAEYKDGILTVEINGSLSEDAEETEYAVIGTDSDGSEKIFSEGKLGDIMTGNDPLTLDLSELKLPEGTYELKVGDESIEFLCY